MSKNYFIVDLQSDYKKFADIKEIRKLLIDVLYDDTLSCRDNPDVVMQNVKVLIDLAKYENVSITILENNLKSYDYKIIDLMQLERDLEDIKQLVGKENLFDEIINIINKGE